MAASAVDFETGKHDLDTNSGQGGFVKKWPKIEPSPYFVHYK
jgi:hypothetical protein